MTDRALGCRPPRHRRAARLLRPSRSFNGRMILVRNVWSNITPNSCRFEQSFSDDGGKTWEVNWIAVDTRIPESSAAAH